MKCRTDILAHSYRKNLWAPLCCYWHTHSVTPIFSVLDHLRI